MNHHPYRGKPIVLVSRHGKARALRVPFRRVLGTAVRTAGGVDTDALGTFSGEVPRREGALATARRKAALVPPMSAPRVIASEGSFGPDPVTGLTIVDWELLLFVDRERHLEIAEVVAAPSRHHGSDCFDDVQAARTFLQRHGFPDHAAVLHPAECHVPLYKGVRDDERLSKAFGCCMDASPSGRVRVEMDLRAHCHPERMAVIARVAWKLAARLHHRCPSCAAPGWGRIERVPGRPCAVCSLPTAETLAIIEGCSACGTRRERPVVEPPYADPACCDHCNP